MMAKFDTYRQSDTLPVNPARLCKEISKSLPDNAVLVSDTGFSAVWSACYIRMKSTQNYFRAAGSLGWAFPASLGVKCALPDRPVFCFAGDGSMYYHLCEIETACRYGINTVTFVNNNGILGQSSFGIQKIFGGDLPRAARRYTFGKCSFAKLAEDLGGVGILVESPDGINEAIEKALALQRPVVIEVLTNPDIGPFPALD
jgi:acetolactate synthase-1/2/3 large subunit